ncbi:MAG: aminotransferase class IV [Bacteroidales bacterium]|jgi:branched-subunit amino acid aminotransferase/4-amino-4-deoxychorismate lyase|nr:aminotransferase class IV [Bacteroidales bacterium]
MNYICLNGEILPAKHANLSLGNRAFRFGEGIVEEMRSTGIRVPLFSAHFERLSKALNILGISFLSAFNEESLNRSLELLIHRKKLYNINKVRITLWREDDDDLLAENVKVQYLIEAEALEEKAFTLNEKGYNINVFPGAYKSKSYLSPFHTTDRLFTMQALRFAKVEKVDACLITNPEGKIIEEATSNIFFANGKTIYTPAIAGGCVAGIMRQKILDIAEKEGYIIIETEPLLSSFIYDVEEIFLTNDVYGIRWVSGYKHKRYRKKRSIDFVYKLNQFFDN